jgi:hypothetical protein
MYKQKVVECWVRCCHCLGQWLSCVLCTTKDCYKYCNLFDGIVSKTIPEWVSIYLVLLSPVGCQEGTAKLINVKSCVRAHELPLCDSNTILIHFMRGNIVKNTTYIEKMYSKNETTCFGFYWSSSGLHNTLRKVYKTVWKTEDGQ